MEVISQKADPVRLFWRRVFILVLAVLVIVGMSGVWRIYKRERESAALNRESAAHLADLMEREAGLKADISDLNTERGKEAALRQQYRMGKPGEGLIIIVDPTAPATTSATSTSSWSSWVKWLFPLW